MVTPRDLTALSGSDNRPSRAEVFRIPVRSKTLGSSLILQPAPAANM